MKIILSLTALALIPVAALAAPNFTYLGDFTGGLQALINNRLVPLVFAIAILMFLWGVFNTFILGGGDEEKQTKGKQLMVYAIIGFVLMVSLWGIVNLVANIFGVDQNKGFNMPVLPGQVNN